jgi:hypothetical protein
MNDAHQPLEPELIELEAELGRLSPLVPDITIYQRIAAAMEPMESPSVPLPMSHPVTMGKILNFWQRPRVRQALPVAAAACVVGVGALTWPAKPTAVTMAAVPGAGLERAKVEMSNSLPLPTALAQRYPGYQAVSARQMRHSMSNPTSLVDRNESITQRVIIHTYDVRYTLYNDRTGDTIQVDEEVRVEERVPLPRY